MQEHRMNWQLKAFTPLAALLCLLGTGLNAGSASAQDNAEAKQYQIELLVFRHSDTSRTTPEITGQLEPQLDDLLDERLAQLGAPADKAVAANNGTRAGMATGPTWTLVGSNAKRMGRAAARINKLGAYELMAHLAWTQTAVDIADAIPINLRQLGLDSALSHGTVKFYKQRYLHLALDVSLGSDGASPRNASSGFLSALQPKAAAPAQPAIKDSRRVRLERLTYFDQPEFGVLAMISGPIE